MAQDFNDFLKNNEELIKKAKIMGWLESSFSQIRGKSLYLRALMLVALKGKCTIDEAANFAKVSRSAISPQLKALKDLGILETYRSNGRLVYIPKLGGSLE